MLLWTGGVLGLNMYTELTLGLLSNLGNYNGLAPAISDIGSFISTTAKYFFAVPLSYYAVQVYGLIQVSSVFFLCYSSLYDINKDKLVKEFEESHVNSFRLDMCPNLTDF